jgi:hypothetical protein
MRRRKGPEFDVIPAFYILPQDWTGFQAAVACHPKRIWIRKPLASSRGRGIAVLSRPEKVKQMCKPCLVQHYIHKPLLIGGLKFDLRLYVAVTCFQPLRVYLYPDGLVRFATSFYKECRASLKDKGMHLTNVSINKKKNHFRGQEEDGKGSKWSLAPLWAHLTELNINVADVWQEIHSIVARTMLAVEPKMSTMVGNPPQTTTVCFPIDRA